GRPREARGQAGLVRAPAFVEGGGETRLLPLPTLCREGFRPSPAKHHAQFIQAPSPTGATETANPLLLQRRAMNTCHLCNQAQNEPFRSFVDGTTTYVCIPDGAECQLYADVDAPGQLTIESHGEEICSEPVDPTRHRFPLSGLLRFNLPWTAPA